MYVVTVSFVIKEENLDNFNMAMLAQARNSLNFESDCNQFDVSFDPADPRRVFLYEVYTDKAAFGLHLKTDHFLSFAEKVKDWFISKEDEKWEMMEK